MRVFVTDGDQRATLAITRSLGRHGIDVVVGATAPRSLASSSRYSAGHVMYPSPRQRPAAFYAWLLEFVRSTRIDVLMPVTDVTTYVVASHKEELAAYTSVGAPDFGPFDFVTDKWRLLQRARELSIPIPRTDFVRAPEDLPQVLGQLRYPVVVKPSRSWMPTERGWIQTCVHYADSESELLRLYRDTEFLRYPSLIQEHIIGPGLGLFVLFERGAPAIFFAHRRLRELPPSGGISVLRESVPSDPSLKDHAVRLLGPINWHGVAMLEYKLDRRTETPCLMEVNGRFWGSLQLAIDAGVDFPFLLYQLTLGRDVQAPRGYRIGVKTRWLVGDLIHTVRRVLGREADLHLPLGSPSRARTVLSFLKFYAPGLRYEDFACGDFSPFLFETVQRLRHLWGSNATDG